MSLVGYLRARSSEYELLAEWHGERAAIDDRHASAADALLVVGIVLSEIAEALDRDWGEDADAS